MFLYLRSHHTNAVARATVRFRVAYSWMDCGRRRVPTAPRSSSRLHERLGIKAAAAGSWEAAQPAPARERSTFKPAPARYDGSIAGPRFRRPRLRSFRRSSHGYPGCASRQWHAFRTPCWNSHRHDTRSRLNAQWRLCRNSRRGHVRSVHHRRFRWRYGDPGRGWHTVGRADRSGDDHKGQAKTADSWTIQHALSRHAILSQAVAPTDALSSCLHNVAKRSATASNRGGVQGTRTNHGKAHHL